MKLTIIRGLPGSGKSTMAKTIPGLHLEADMFQVVNGKYQFDYWKLGTAHRLCREMTRSALANGSDVVVSNTTVKESELNQYLQIADDCQADVEIIHMETSYGSIHDVPQDVINKMRELWYEHPGEVHVR